MEVDNYFPNLSAVESMKEKLSRKQSIYFDAEMKDKLTRKQSLYFDCTDGLDNLSGSEESTAHLHARSSFRLRSGTDISDSLSAARYKQKLKRARATSEEVHIQEISNVETDKANNEV